LVKLKGSLCFGELSIVNGPDLEELDFPIIPADQGPLVASVAYSGQMSDLFAPELHEEEVPPCADDATASEAFNFIDLDGVVPLVEGVQNHLGGLEETIDDSHHLPLEAVEAHTVLVLLDLQSALYALGREVVLSQGRELQVFPQLTHIGPFTPHDEELARVFLAAEHLVDSILAIAQGLYLKVLEVEERDVSADGT